MGFKIPIPESPFGFETAQYNDVLRQAGPNWAHSLGVMTGVFTHRGDLL